MTDLFGTSHSRAGIAARTGELAQIGGVRLVTLSDGAERGVRLLEFRTGAGLDFTVAVDRAMDIAELRHDGRSIGWHSPTGLRNPALNAAEEEDGLGLMRSFSGFLVTCGLDHALGPEEVPGDTYGYPRKAIVPQPLHGRVAMTPARLAGYGETWQGDRCILWAEGVVRQAAVFGEVLHLYRRIEADLGGTEIRLSDRVVNAGFRPTPHMLLYHVNLGYPLLDAGARYVAPIRRVLWALHEERGLDAQGVGYRTVPDPVPGFSEQVWEHEMAADAAGEVPVALLNARLGLGLQVTARAGQLPCALQWQNFQPGHYVMGIEPSTHHVAGDLAARERGEMIWLQAGEERAYDLRFSVLAGAPALEEAEARIHAITPQPAEDFPAPTGDLPRLWQG